MVFAAIESAAVVVAAANSISWVVRWMVHIHDAVAAMIVVLTLVTSSDLSVHHHVLLNGGHGGEVVLESCVRDDVLLANGLTVGVRTLVLMVSRQSMSSAGAVNEVRCDTLFGIILVKVGCDVVSCRTLVLLLNRLVVTRPRFVVNVAQQVLDLEGRMLARAADCNLLMI